MASHSRISELLGVFPLSKLEMAEKIETGLPLVQVQRLRDAGLTFLEVSELVISPRTLKHRKSREESLSPEETERALRVSRLLSRAEDVFGDMEPALIWLRAAPSDKLNGRTPMSMLRTEPGGNLVDRCSGRSKRVSTLDSLEDQQTQGSGRNWWREGGCPVAHRCSWQVDRVYLAEHPAVALIETLVNLSVITNAFPTALSASQDRGRSEVRVRDIVSELPVVGRTT